MLNSFSYNQILVLMQVANYIPSISAATGDFTPQKYIWRIGIALHSLPNIGVAFVYYNYYADSVHIVKNWRFRMANRVNTALHTVENFALLALTYISSKENHGEFQIYNLYFRPDQFNFRELGSDRPYFCRKQKKIKNGPKIFICM